jgi:hypothetical protein
MIWAGIAIFFHNNFPAIKQANFKKPYSTKNGRPFNTENSVGFFKQQNNLKTPLAKTEPIPPPSG